MKKIFKFLKLLSLSVILVLSSQQFSAEESIISHDQLLMQEQSLKKAPSKRNSPQPKLSTSEIEKLQKEVEKQKEHIFAIEYQKDIQVGNILLSHTQEEQLRGKAESDSKEDKVAIMYKIVDLLNNNNYSISEEDLSSLVSYITKYAPYTEEEQLKIFAQKNIDKQFPKSEEQKNPSIDTRNIIGGYNHTGVSNHAARYGTVASNYDPAAKIFFPYLDALGGDCTNFVSVAMYRGGKLPMFKSWYMYNKISTPNYYPQNVSQLDASWNLTNKSPWISAPEFEKFFSPIVSNKVYSYNDLKTYGGRANMYYSPAIKGDIVQFRTKKLWWEQAYHTAVITGYDSVNTDFLISYHSNNRSNVGLINHYLKLSGQDDTTVKVYTFREGWMIPR